MEEFVACIQVWCKLDGRDCHGEGVVMAPMAPLTWPRVMQQIAQAVARGLTTLGWRPGREFELWVEIQPATAVPDSQLDLARRQWEAGESHLAWTTVVPLHRKGGAEHG